MCVWECGHVNAAFMLGKDRCEAPPEDDAISNRFEQRIRVWVHGQDVLAVGVLFQSRVDPVHEGESLLL